MFFDTHAHLDDSAFDEDRDEVIERIRKAGVDRVLNPGCDEKSTRMAAELSEKYSFICFAAGFHPEELAGLLLGQHPESGAAGAPAAPAAAGIGSG